MAIPIPLVPTSSFGPDELKAIGVAFDHALCRLGLNDRNDLRSSIVAREVIALALKGERNPRRLCAAAVNAFLDAPAAHA
jgi:hypothetical protein